MSADEVKRREATMTPLEELQAAHKRLSELRDDGPWSVEYRDADSMYGVAAAQRVWWVATAVEEERDADLIVTLHRTIDAQLETLSVAGALLAFVDNNSGRTWLGGVVGRQVRAATDLARAINGEATDAR